MNTIRPDEPFLGILSPEKTDALKRGEAVTITAEESSRFMTLMDEIKDQRIADLESRVAKDPIAIQRISLPTLEKCPFCGLILMSSDEAKNAEHGGKDVCPGCSAVLTLEQLTNYSVTIPHTLGCYMEYLKALGWKILPPPEDEGFWSAATAGLGGMTPKRQQVALGAIEDPQILRRMKEALDPVAASIEGFAALAAQGKIAALVAPSQSPAPNYF